MISVEASSLASAIRSRLPGVGRLKLHKLMYYVQAWHLTGTGMPAFSDPIKAWQNGPVVSALWGAEEHGDPPPTSEQLDPDVEQTLDYVCERYGHLSGATLKQRTHDEDPWKNAWTLRHFSDTINHNDIVDWFQHDTEYMEHQRKVERLLESPLMPRLDEPVVDTPEIAAARERALAKLNAR